MEFAKSVSIRVFVKPEDDEEVIKKTFIKLLSLEREIFEKLLVREEAEGFNERKIIILRINLKKRNQINKFMTKLFNSITYEDKMLILDQLKSRIDDQCHLFIRLEKDLLKNDIYSITDKGNCFHIDISLPIYPCKKEKAIEYAKKMIESFI